MSMYFYKRCSLSDSAMYLSLKPMLGKPPISFVSSNHRFCVELAQPQIFVKPNNLSRFDPRRWIYKRPYVISFKPFLSNCSGFNTSNFIFNHIASFSQRNYSCLSQARFSCSSSNNGNDDGNQSSTNEILDTVTPEDVSTQEPSVNPPSGALSTLTVPEIFPRVPVIAVCRNPVFPRFVKMLEVRDLFLYCLKFYCYILYFSTIFSPLNEI